MIVEQIQSVEDLKKIPSDKLEAVCAELRQVFLTKLSAHGGHVGPNLGALELTVALHRVFNSPTDKFVFDVSHQTYIHKMVTGRINAFLDPAHYDDVSGYTEPSESEHDQFIIGHTSTSVSLATGLAKARDLKGAKHNVIAVIGDGSLSGGEAYEGFNNAAELGTNFIAIVNDNQMSIAENHGGLYRSLAALRVNKGEGENFFRAMGLDYVYIDEGNDVHALIAALEKVKDIDHPVVVHVNTEKGHGYRFATENKEGYHWRMPFDLETGKDRQAFTGENYGDLLAEAMLDEIKRDPNYLVMTAAVPAMCGFTPERRARAGRQYWDVGIAEEHAVAMASGLAKGGARAVFNVASTFVQRTYDQISQDLCVNGNPATMLVWWGSLSVFNDVTHLCWFDIPLLSNIPNLVYLAPTCREEMMAMFAWATRQTKHPVAIRVPANGVVPANGRPVDASYDAINTYQVTKRGSRVAVFALGSFYQLGEQVVAALAEKGVEATLVNPRFATGVDEKLLKELAADHTVALTLEDGVVDGGFGEKIARFYGPTTMKTLVRGGRKEFRDRFDRQALLRELRLTPAQLTADVLAAL